MIEPTTYELIPVIDVVRLELVANGIDPQMIDLDGDKLFWSNFVIYFDEQPGKTILQVDNQDESVQVYARTNDLVKEIYDL